MDRCVDCDCKNEALLGCYIVEDKLFVRPIVLTLCRACAKTLGLKQRRKT
jgi:hypothetical protein